MFIRFKKVIKLLGVKDNNKVSTYSFITRIINKYPG